MPLVTKPTLQFVYNPGLSGFAIALKGGIDLSHVDAVLDDGRLLGARYDNPGGFGKGVRIRDRNYEKWSKVVRIEYKGATAYQLGDWRGFLYEQLEKPYDWRSIVGFALNRNWRDQDSWFCSELATAAAEQAGLISPLYEGVNKVDPGMCIAAHTAAGWTLC